MHKSLLSLRKFLSSKGGKFFGTGLPRSKQNRFEQEIGTESGLKRGHDTDEWAAAQRFPFSDLRSLRCLLFKVPFSFLLQTRRADRIMAGQNHQYRTVSPIMILSGHDSVVIGCGWPPCVYPWSQEFGCGLATLRNTIQGPLESGQAASDRAP